MAIDPRKRQKKLERRKAKQKQQRRELAHRQPQGLSAQLEQAATAPVLHCCVMANIWESGMGQLLFSRQLRNGDVAVAIFLLDVYCLGVKNAMALIAGRAKYDLDIYGKLARNYTLLRQKPECARKLVEGAVRYRARSRLFTPRRLPRGEADLWRRFRRGLHGRVRLRQRRKALFHCRPAR